MPPSALKKKRPKEAAPSSPKRTKKRRVSFGKAYVRRIEPRPDVPEDDEDEGSSDEPDDLMWDGEDDGFLAPGESDEDEDEDEDEGGDGHVALEQAEDSEQEDSGDEGGPGVDMTGEGDEDSDEVDEEDALGPGLGVIDEDEDEEDEEDDDEGDDEEAEEDEEFPSRRRRMRETLRAQGDDYESDDAEEGDEYESDDVEEDDVEEDEEEDDDDYDEIKAKYDAIMREQAAERAQADDQGEEDEDDEESDAEESNSDDEAPTKSGFNNILSGILGREISKGQGTILAQRPGLLRKVEDQSKVGKLQAAERLVKKELLNKDHMTKLETDVVYEKNLLRIATRGVVKFFSAVANQNKAAAKSIPSTRTSKGDDEDDDQEREQEDKVLSKDGLMAALKGKKEPKVPRKESKKAGWMEDDYATQGKAGWDQESSEED